MTQGKVSPTAQEIWPDLWTKEQLEEISKKELEDDYNEIRKAISGM